MDIIRFTVGELAIPALVVAAVAWLSRETVRAVLAKQHEQFKQDVSHEYALTIERLRVEALRQIEEIRHESTLDIERHKSRVVRLQDARLEPLLDLYGAISKTAMDAQHIHTLLAHRIDFDVDVDLSDLDEGLAKARSKLSQALLFLPSETEKVASKVIEVVSTATMNYEIDSHEHSKSRAIADLESGLSTDFRALAAELATQLRQLLGVESQGTPNGQMSPSVQHGG